MEDLMQFKRDAGELAAQEVQSGMIVGLGTGSTAVWAVRRIAERIKAGELTDILGIPTSIRTESEARSLGLSLTTLEYHPEIDITIDGADEIDPAFHLIKGGGGALLREKIVAQASQRMIVAGDMSKPVDQLGAFPLPVEVVRFGHGSHPAFLKSLGAATVTLRRGEDGEAFQTDSGNYIYDCEFGVIENPVELAETLIRRAGIVEHGLFIDLATESIIGTPDGIVRQTRP